MKTYSGLIKELKKNQIFVFGSNPQGIHGAGAAYVAANKFGAKYGVGRGLTGRCYALPTKNLTTGFIEKATGICYKKSGMRSISKDQITANIAEFYACAKLNPKWEFMVAYTASGSNLNGYTNEEMAEMFASSPIPDNVVFEEGFAKLLSK